MDMEGDRLSSLPDDIIHKILSYSDTKHAIKTSALSYRFRSTWKSVQHLSFSCEDYTLMRKFSESVDHVLSHRDNKIEVSSVKLIICKNFSHVSFQKLMKYAFSHNVQEITITCLENFKVEFPLSLTSSQSLKHLTLIGGRSYGPVKLISTWEFPALTTLHLDHVILYEDESVECVGLFSKCINLKNLTLNRCRMFGFDHSLQVSNPLPGFNINVVAPQLENLSLVLDYLFPLFLGGLPYLEKADICIRRALNAHGIISMLQQLNGVKYLTLNVEILEVLSSSSVELIPKQPSPFANLRSLEIYPLYVDSCEKENMSSVVKKYLLDLSPDATFKMVSREEIKAIKCAGIKYGQVQVGSTLFGFVCRS